MQNAKYVHVMVKEMILILLFYSFISCSSNVNEYGKIRYSNSSLSSYSEKCILNDSQQIFNHYYKLVPPDAMAENDLRKNYLVFYERGRVGNFLDFEEDNFDFNPKKAEMGYFGVKNGKCWIKFKVEYPDGYRILEEEIVFIDKDTIKIHTKKSASTDGFTSTYVKVNGQNLKNDKSPDW